MSELFDAVDALIAGQSSLPPTAERERLRKAHGLSQEQVAAALKVRRATVVSWENGRTEPRPPQREAYARLLTQLAELYPAEPATPAPVPAPAPVAPAPAAQAPAPALATPEPVAPEPAAEVAEPAPVSPAARNTAARGPAGQPPRTVKSTTSRTTTARTTRARTGTATPTTPAAAVPPDPRFLNGPLGVLDGDGSLYCVGGLVLDCPATTVASLVEWTLAEARLGSPRLHRSGKDGDPLVVLTTAAAERLGLPATLEDRRGLRLPENHKVVQQVTKARWQLTRRGFGPWTRIYRPVQSGQRQCVQFAVLPWGALDARSWGAADRMPPEELAAVLGTFARRVITPRGSTAVSGLELMTALRPPTRAVPDGTTGAWTSGPVAGSLAEPVDPAPPEAPDEHPVAAALFPRGHRRTPAEVLDEEAYEWVRDPQLLTDAECERKYAVGIDVNTAFLAAANRLLVGLGAPVHVRAPVFDKAVPGSWLIDLSGIELDPRLPSPFTPHGVRPDGPAWYATPTVAYAYELIATYRLPVTAAPLEAWVRPESGPYLDPWYKHLSEAYKTTMADLGVGSGVGEKEFLAAMATHKETDPGMGTVLSAIKSTVKGGIGKLRERPQGASYRYGDRWPALERPTWRPDIRAAVISAARINMHRKILKTALATQSSPAPAGHLTFDEDALIPVALLSDCAVYLADGPSPLDVLPRTPEGKPAPGSFRLGVSTGMVKHEGTQDLLWAVRMLDEGHNPARHIKGNDAADDGE
ncbi:helix-turn-helix transcriptional regulator [Streptomyces sp. NPDC052164]|uniref:telomere-associated protein Tap n=1 Tax=Streptomyces sp. NPDC052164 TaxID=3155529 RepID=UPI003444151D